MLLLLHKVLNNSVWHVQEWHSACHPPVADTAWRGNFVLAPSVWDEGEKLMHSTKHLALVWSPAEAVELFHFFCVNQQWKFTVLDKCHMHSMGSRKRWWRISAISRLSTGKRKEVKRYGSAVHPVWRGYRVTGQQKATAHVCPKSHIQNPHKVVQNDKWKKNSPHTNVKNRNEEDGPEIVHAA